MNICMHVLYILYIRGQSIIGLVDYLIQYFEFFLIVEISIVFLKSDCSLKKSQVTKVSK